ncbi:MAG: hypothetical protein AABY15_03660 [Nanoarchaeota archaeon]
MKQIKDKRQKAKPLVRSSLTSQTKAQEEMVGFALIIIIVAVIILVLLGISLNNPKTKGVESYEVESFIQASLQHTTACSTDFEVSYEDISGLITECDDRQICEDGRDTCAVLDSAIKDILKEAWKVGEDRPVKGYALRITSKDSIILSLNKGNVTSNYKGGVQPLPKRGAIYSIEFRAYY